jgi:hypothetical protein
MLTSLGSFQLFTPGLGPVLPKGPCEQSATYIESKALLSASPRPPFGNLLGVEPRERSPPNVAQPQRLASKLTTYAQPKRKVIASN